MNPSGIETEDSGKWRVALHDFLEMTWPDLRYRTKTLQSCTFRKQWSLFFLASMTSSTSYVLIVFQPPPTILQLPLQSSLPLSTSLPGSSWGSKTSSSHSLFLGGLMCFLALVSFICWWLSNTYSHLDHLSELRPGQQVHIEYLLLGILQIQLV